MRMPARQQQPAPLDEVSSLVGGRKIIVASNRGPVEFHRDAHGKLTTKRGSGGVVTALAALAASLPLTWIAAAMSEADREAFPDRDAPAREVRLGRAALRVRYVNVPPAVYARHYDEISNELLWFLQHYLWDVASAPNITERQYVAWDQGYRTVNHALADAVADEAQAPAAAAGKRRRPAGGSDVLVMLQDYHLYLAAARVRERLPHAILQQFIHIPWPAARYWQFLPERLLHEIFESLAANDVLGFQTEGDARNFLECARWFLPNCRMDLDDGRLICRRQRLLARVYPVTADGEEIRQSLNSAAGRKGAQELGPLLADDRQVIVRVDRLEPTKNIVRGFLAYERLLAQHPELASTVRFLAFLVPSRQGLPLYRRYERAVRKIVQRINSTSGTPDWQPITIFVDNNRPRALAAMRRYDVLLVNPIIDGMNLVAKEGPLANARDGVVILSRTAGAYEQLREAVLPVTPTDIEETADQLYEALVMPARERRQRAELARGIVQRETPADWMRSQLSDAAEVRRAAAQYAGRKTLARAM
jgi:trehalose 6-phosphate synthase